MTERKNEKKWLIVMIMMVMMMMRLWKKLLKKFLTSGCASVQVINITAHVPNQFLTLTGSTGGDILLPELSLESCYFRLF